MATEIVAQIDAAWSADKWKIKGRGTHRMIGPQQKKSRLASMCKGQPHGTEWLADHQVAPDHVDVCKSTAAARTCWRNRVILATASFASLSISSATRSFFHRPSTLWCFRDFVIFSGYQPILSASFVSAAAVAAAHRLNNPLLSGRATPWKMKETAPRRLQSDHTLQQ